MLENCWSIIMLCFEWLVNFEGFVIVLGVCSVITLFYILASFFRF